MTKHETEPESGNVIDINAILRKYLKSININKIREDFGELGEGFGNYGSHEKMIRPKDLASRVKMAKSFDGLNIFTASRAKDIGQIIAFLIMRDSINPDNLEGTVVDFGMGTGPGAYVLNQYGGTITGVDSSQSGVQTAIEEGILPEDKALVKDGFEYLRSLQPQSIDFLAAFMMHSGFPHERLYQESQRVLKSGGQLLITGGLVELKDELQRAVGKYGKIEDVLTVHEKVDVVLGSVAFTYTKI